jgi:2'-5' RNA ligase
MDRKRFIGGYPDTGHYGDDGNWESHVFDETNHPSPIERERMRYDRQAKDPEHARRWGSTLYHGTTKANADSIAKDGFHLDNTTNGRHAGEGIYLHHSKAEAAKYGDHVVEAKVDDSGFHENPWGDPDYAHVPTEKMHAVLGADGYHGHNDPDDGSTIVYNPAHIHVQKVHTPGSTTQKVGHNVWDEVRGFLAGRGKPRRSDPGGQSGRGGTPDQLGQGQAPADQSRGDGSSTGLVTWHPGTEKDLRGLHHGIQSKVRTRAQGLADGNRHASTHPLTGALKGWEGTHVDFLHRMVHRSTPDGVEVGWVGPHDYDKAIRRLTSKDPRFEGTSLKQDDDGWYVSTHRARSDSYDSPEAIPQKDVDFIESTGKVRHPGGPNDGDDGDPGIMIAIVPPQRVVKNLPIPEDGESPDNIHVTVAYLGKSSEHTKAQLADLPELIEAWAETEPKLDARVQGVGTFVNEGSHVLWAAVDMPGVNEMHVRLCGYLDAHGFQVRKDHSFTPHMTLKYHERPFRFMPKIEPEQFRVREIWCCIGGRWESFGLKG